MDLFDKLGDTIVSVSKDATQKAKDISELARIRMEIRSKQDYINKLFQETGRLYYESHKDDEIQEFEDQISLISDAQDVLDELKQQLGQLKGTQRCLNCGQEMPLDADYCSRCGTKLVKKEEEEAEEKKEDEIILEKEMEQEIKETVSEENSDCDAAEEITQEQSE